MSPFADEETEGRRWNYFLKAIQLLNGILQDSYLARLPHGLSSPPHPSLPGMGVPVGSAYPGGRWLIVLTQDAAFFLGKCCPVSRWALTTASTAVLCDVRPLAVGTQKNSCSCCCFPLYYDYHQSHNSTWCLRMCVHTSYSGECTSFKST